jgi:sugar phosphate isomerase/epimerase
MTEQLKTNWGISTLGCHELDLPSICKLAEKHGIHHLEIRSLADCLDLPSYLDITYPDDPNAIKKILNQHRQSIIALNSGFSLIGAGKDARDELLAFARWAEQLQVPYIRVFGGGDMDEPLSESDIATSVANLLWWKEQREKNAWKTDVALETHGGFSSGARCVALQKAFGHQLDIIWDTHHTWKLGNESANVTWDQIGSMTKHVHIKDSVSVPSARHPYSYCLLGEGEFPADDVFTVLSDNQFNGVVSLEWERKWHPYLPDLDEALESLKTSGWRSSSNTPTSA